MFSPFPLLLLLVFPLAFSVFSYFEVISFGCWFYPPVHCPHPCSSSEYKPAKLCSVLVLKV